MFGPHEPLKTKLLRTNNSLHMSKYLRKAIVKRSRLKNIANKSKLPEDSYRKQRNLHVVVYVNRKEKKSLFDIIDEKSRNSRNFWKAFKPLFSNSVAVIGERILLVEDKKLYVMIASIFNGFFNTITNSLNIPTPISCSIESEWIWIARNVTYLKFTYFGDRSL